MVTLRIKTAWIALFAYLFSIAQILMLPVDARPVPSPSVSITQVTKKPVGGVSLVPIRDCPNPIEIKRPNLDPLDLDVTGSCRVCPCLIAQVINPTTVCYPITVGINQCFLYKAEARPQTPQIQVQKKKAEKKIPLPCSISIPSHPLLDPQDLPLANGALCGDIAQIVNPSRPGGACGSVQINCHCAFGGITAGAGNNGKVLTVCAGVWTPKTPTVTAPSGSAGQIQTKGTGCTFCHLTITSANCGAGEKYVHAIAIGNGGNAASNCFRCGFTHYPIVLGGNAKAKAVGGIAIGVGACASGGVSAHGCCLIAIGECTLVSSCCDSIAMGGSAKVRSNCSIGIGHGACICTGSGSSVIVGDDAFISKCNPNSVVVGKCAGTEAACSVVIGKGAREAVTAGKTGGIVIGGGAKICGGGCGSITLGKCSISKACATITIGKSALVCVGSCSIALGPGSTIKLKSGAVGAIAIGHNAKVCTNSSACTDANAIAIGTCAMVKGRGQFSIAMGKCALSCAACDTVTIGVSSKTTGCGDIAIGRCAKQCGSSSFDISLGAGAVSKGCCSTAIGHFAKTAHNGAVAVGPCAGSSTAACSGACSIALGKSTKAKGACSVAIGRCAVATCANTMVVGNACHLLNTTINGTTTITKGFVRALRTVSCANATIATTDYTIGMTTGGTPRTATTPAKGGLVNGQSWEVIKLCACATGTITPTAGACVTLIGVVTPVATAGKRVRFTVVKAACGTVATGEFLHHCRQRSLRARCVGTVHLPCGKVR